MTYLNCQAIGTPSDASNTYQFTTALGSNLDQNGSTIDYSTWIGTTMTTCLEMKAIWGLSIALWYDVWCLERPESANMRLVFCLRSL